jgi:arylsulfatase A-like enzyme
MFKVMKVLLVALGFVFFVYILLFLTVIYPNDARIPMPDLNALKKETTSRSKLSSLFLDAIEFKFDVLLEDYRNHIQVISKKFSNHLSTSSERFKNPYQIYLSLGSYPYHLSGQDAILLPSEKQLSLSPRLEGNVELDLEAATLFSDAHIDIFHNNERLDTLHLKKSSPPEESKSFLYKNFIRYAFPERAIQGGVWDPYKIQIHLKKEDTLSFLCHTEKEGCFINEPSFWKKTPLSNKNKNVIFVLVDTFRFDALQSKHAPFLKNLKETSVSFERAMGAGNMTSISTNALLSCQAPSKIDRIAFSYGIPISEQNKYYKTGRHSFAHILQNKGIKTAMIGNISIISEILGIGVNHGFQNQISIEMEGYDTALITKASIDWLEKNSSDPFFLYIHYNSPHAPYRAPIHDVWASLDELSALTSQRAFLLKMYQAEIRYIDRYLAVLSQALEKLGLKENTVLIINSDHADTHELRTYYENEAGPAYTGSLFDHVGTLLYNDVLHVPLLISFPNKKIGEKIFDFVSSLDIGPTVLSLFGLTKPEWCDGVSLLSKEELKDRSIIGAEGEGQRTIFLEKRYKYIKSYEKSEKRITPATGYFTKNASIFIKEQLFDLNNDPDENVNLVSSKNEVLNKTRQAFNTYFEIHDTASLIIDNPKGEKVEVIFSQDLFDLLEKKESLEKKGALWRFESLGVKRTVFQFKQLPSTSPRIFIADKALPLRYSSIKLPLHALSSLKSFPGEEFNPDAVPISREASAFLVKTKSDQTMLRKLSFGNSQFENIFKEWGYLVDEK